MLRIKRLVRVCAFVWVIVGTMTFSTTGGVFAQDAAQEVIIEVKGPTEDDDYLCWSPVQARAKLAVPVAYPVAINLGSIIQDGGGEVWFQVGNGARPTQATFAPTNQISMTLPGDGSWVTFWIAGLSASNGSKDVSVVALDEAGNELGTLPVMVRVRKNAEKLSPVEVSQFLTALATVHDLANGGANSVLNKHVTAHDLAFREGIHGAPSGQPLFLAWHRGFLLNLERELQAVDPRVSLPYWRYDQPTEKLFTLDFLGTIQGGTAATGGFLVQFAPTNPLWGWKMADGQGALVRRQDAAATFPIPANRLEDIFAVTFNQEYLGVNGALEDRYHNTAHNHIGGWLASRASPRDPVFYLLHANTDRAWAHWQVEFDRFNPADAASYSAQGTYELAVAGGANPFRKGSYAQDVMWPWSGIRGDQGTPDPRDDWPNLAHLMPLVPGAEGPLLPPKPADMVDYLDLAGQGLSHGACYDDIDYNGNLISYDD